eukprot:1334551-Amorphochlora_amoeboformis.AAC.1
MATPNCKRVPWCALWVDCVTWYNVTLCHTAKPCYYGEEPPNGWYILSRSPVISGDVQQPLVGLQ